MLLVCVFDKVQGEYSAPIMAANEATAKRWFYKTMRTAEFDPADFQLYLVGYLDVKTGKIEPDFGFICNGNAFDAGGVLDE